MSKLLNNPYAVAIPALIIVVALLIAAVMADKLWLHWYTSDGAGTTVKREAQNGSPQAGAAIPSAQSRDAFAALWLTSQQAPYQVRYETSSETGEAGDSYVVFNRPPNARVDTIAAGANTPSSQVIVAADGSTVACSFDGGEPSCGQITSFDAPLPLAAGPIVFPTAGSFDSIIVAELESKEIAGVTARCFNVSQADAGNSADYCFSADNVPVYGSGMFGVVRASKLSSTSETDFVLPTP